jgi:hypothetical protein
MITSDARPQHDKADHPIYIGAHRQRQLLHLYWILAHKPPEEGEPYRDPPPPPWL